jgi:hypothetical protein
MQALGPATTEAECRGLAYYLTYYREYMLDDTVIYPAVREGLAALGGLPMAVPTTSRYALASNYSRGSAWRVRSPPWYTGAGASLEAIGIAANTTKAESSACRWRCLEVGTIAGFTALFLFRRKSVNTRAASRKNITIIPGASLKKRDHWEIKPNAMRMQMVEEIEGSRLVTFDEDEAVDI